MSYARTGRSRVLVVRHHTAYYRWYRVFQVLRWKRLTLWWLVGKPMWVEVIIDPLTGLRKNGDIGYLKIEDLVRVRVKGKPGTAAEPTEDPAAP